MSKYPDSIDKKILSLPEQNARISNAELAEKVNLSPTPCLRRLRRLENSGLIRGYGAVLDEKALGLQASALVFVNLDKNTKENAEHFEAALNLLTEDHEVQLMRSISRFPETVEAAARLRSPHMMAHYLHSLATDLHAYYNAHQFLVNDENLRNARLNLVLATRIVLAHGLSLLGVSAPEEM